MRKVYRVVSLVVLVTMIVSVWFVGSIDANARTGPYTGRLTGVNWFGFETSNYCAHGIWARDYKSVLLQIKDLGFNCVRIPWCNEMIGKKADSVQINATGVDPYTKKLGLNLDLAGLDSLGVLDRIIQESARLGLMIILDNHSREAGGYMNETLWYTAVTSEEKWISDWVMLAKRYKDYDNVVAYDLNNEPHGNLTMGMKPPASWGYEITEGYKKPEWCTTTDWKAAAEKCGVELLKVNPNALIIIEGVENYKGENYWWGGNLKGVKDYPITKIPKANLMYSPHEYGPEVYPQEWYTSSEFPKNMPKIWDDNFWFIHKENISPIFIGEFGIKDTSASSIPGIWLRTLMEYAGGKCSWTFWCMNPNSGDTGGILQGDWVSVEKGKVDLIKPYMAPQMPPFQLPSSVDNPTSEPSSTPTSPQSTKPTVKPTSTPEPTHTSVSMVEDLNDDGVVNMSDIMLLASSFGSIKGDKNYNEKYDLNKDSSINMSDVIILAKSFGAVY